MIFSTGEEWTGPLDSDYLPGTQQLRPNLPPERWPYGPASFHEDCCILRFGVAACDCKASDASDSEWGVGL